VILMTLVLVYHFNTSHANHDDVVLDHKIQVKEKYISCEGGACDEKNDHAHDHKKKRKKISNVYDFNLVIKAS